MSRSLRITPQTLPVLLALVWLCAQTFLAWHAPAHISAASTDYVDASTVTQIDSSDIHGSDLGTSPVSASSPLNDTVSASQDCQFGVNGHGVAAIPATAVVECRPRQQPFVYTRNETPSYTSAQFTQARAPPTSA